MYFNIETNPFFKPASTMNDERRFDLINHFRFQAMNARKEPLIFESYVFYALIRGADIRKTSHLADGDNAIEALKHIRNELRRHLERVEKFEKPVMNHFLQRFLGEQRMKRGLPLGVTKEMSDHYGAITIDLNDMLAVANEGLVFYQDVDQPTHNNTVA